MIDILIDKMSEYRRIKRKIEQFAKNDEEGIWHKILKMYEEDIKEWFQILPEYRIGLIERAERSKGEWRALLEQDIRVCEQIMATRNAKFYQDSS